MQKMRNSSVLKRGGSSSLSLPCAIERNLCWVDLVSVALTRFSAQKAHGGLGVVVRPRGTHLAKGHRRALVKPKHGVAAKHRPLRRGFTN